MTSADDALLSSVSGFEAIGIIDELDAGTDVDISVFNVNAMVIESGLNGDETVSGFSSGASIEIQTDALETDVLTIGMSNATDVGSDTDELNILFNADLEAGEDLNGAVFDVKGINVISVVTAFSTTGETTDAGTLPDSSDGYQLSLSSDGNVSTLMVSGDHALSFATTDTSTLEAVTADNMSGNLTLDFLTAFGGTQGVQIIAADGADDLTGSAYGDLIAAGAGDDWIQITTGPDQISGGDGADTFFIGAADISTQILYTAIQDFSAVAQTEDADTLTTVASAITADIADVEGSAAETSGGEGMTITADVVNGIISLAGSDADTIDTLDEWTDLAFLACETGKTIGFEFNGNTYIVEEAGTGGSADSFVELTGLTSITALAGTAGTDTVMISA